jgi:uncharacterized protein YjiS (DUF1127 family)
MVMSDLIHPVARYSSSFAGSPSRRRLAELFRRWLARRKERRTLNELRQMSPHLLDDIGLLEHVRGKIAE